MQLQIPLLPKPCLAFEQASLAELLAVHTLGSVPLQQHVLGPLSQWCLQQLEVPPHLMLLEPHSVHPSVLALVAFVYSGFT